jgi:hypothetical protein
MREVSASACFPAQGEPRRGKEDRKPYKDRVLTWMHQAQIVIGGSIAWVQPMCIVLWMEGGTISRMVAVSSRLDQRDGGELEEPDHLSHGMHSAL